MSSKMARSKVRAELEEKVRTTIEFYRWMNIGPVQDDLNVRQRWYLLCLGAYEELGASELSRILGDLPATAHGTIHGLKAKGYVDIIKGHNEKKKKAKLTTRGIEKYSRLCSFLASNSKINPIGLKL